MHNHPIPDPDSNPPTRRRFLQGAGGALSSPLWARLLGCGGSSKVQLQESRKKAAHRRRRIILDDDGDLCYSDDAKKSIEAFLQQRLKPAAELPIDSIAWCIMWGIAIGKGETRYWETQQQGRVLNSVLSDPTPIMVEAGREHDIEIFGSMRMNDTHDSYGMPAGKLIYPLKVQHPEWLIGDESQKGKVFSTQEAATWSGLDFAIPEVREDRLWWIRNSVENYDLAGLDLNFFRMPWYFKPGKEEEGMPLMTELIRSAREVVDRASESKGKPVLLGVRTPGTVDTCRRIGLDIETLASGGTGRPAPDRGRLYSLQQPCRSTGESRPSTRSSSLPVHQLRDSYLWIGRGLSRSRFQYSLGGRGWNLPLEFPLSEGSPNLLRTAPARIIRGVEPHRFQGRSQTPGQALRRRLRAGHIGDG